MMEVKSGFGVKGLFDSSKVQYERILFVEAKVLNEKIVIREKIKILIRNPLLKVKCHNDIMT